MRILHLTQCPVAGVPHAIERYARGTSEVHEHHLLAVPEVDVEKSAFASFMPLPSGTLGRIREVARAVKKIRPDVIHAHSSFAGGYARLAPVAVPIVYQPHCFAFDDPGRPWAVRGAYWAAEVLLGVRSTLTVALTPHERALARSIGQGRRTVEVPNVSNVEPLGASVVRRHVGRALRVAMIGRIAPQKDPAFFAETARNLGLNEGRNPGVELVWIGGGDPQDEATLRDSGVTVTGWTDREGVARQLDEADLYLHSAAYEGFPLSVLDAAARNVPVVVRDISCFRGYDIRKVSSPKEAAALLTTLTEDRSPLNAIGRQSDALLQHMNPASQKNALLDLYSRAVGSAALGKEH
ncbi:MULTISPECIES: glycosyltransferase [Micrococcus]|uniref:D-inositol 3-phosphate glycosyltransferase n=1 Tax=Micrococcus lylae TaxID=1273 RepID=A0ABY2K217_9MICC|nr:MULTISPECIES: glycosyltransferase [Micrococcus]OFR90822.1 hypothetical protein HMPREF2863_06275 [Micrococcus sp. HMSC067E09]TFI01213.1 glycosyltransferase [Micrococcus lylae]